jgi:IS5 family transposase
LDPDNRWIKLANIIPWDQFETKYAAKFTKNNMGAPAKPVRMALGALILKERCGCSDEELVEQIKENPYLQFFIGLPEFQKKASFDPSMMTYFRKRFDAQTLQEINDIICGVKPKKDSEESRPDQTPPDPDGKDNRGPASRVKALRPSPQQVYRFGFPGRSKAAALRAPPCQTLCAAQVAPLRCPILPIYFVFS